MSTTNPAQPAAPDRAAVAGDGNGARPLDSIVTLVHGTFDRRANWTRATSPLASELAARLPGRTGAQTFVWSGRNSHRARVDAGRRLARRLDANARLHPGARQVVIAHSHGGNVALYALRHRQTTTPVDIACLATPFLVCRDRRDISPITHLAWIIMSIMLAFYLVLMVLSFLPDGLVRTRGQPPPMWSYVLGWVIVYAALWAYIRRATRIWRERLAWPDGAGIRLMTVSYPYDEAKMLLASLGIGTTRISRAIWTLLGALFTLWAAYALLTALVWKFFPDLYRSELFTTIKWWGEGPGALRTPRHEFYFLLFCMMVPPLVFTAYLLPLLRGHPLGYGWEWPSMTMLLDVDTRDTPDGFAVDEAQHVQLEAPDAGMRAGRWAHSTIYDDPRLPAALAAWLDGDHSNRSLRPPPS